MNVLLRRVAFGFFWGGIFWLALLVIGGGIAGALAGRHDVAATESFEQGYERGHDAGVIAGIAFRERYGGWILIAAIVLATIGTVAGELPGTRRK